MDFRPVAQVFGIIVVVLGLFSVFPGLADWMNDGPDTLVFLASAGTMVFVGGILAIAFRAQNRGLTLSQAFLLTPLCWFGLPLFAALPLHLGHQGLSWSNAYFEAVSGLTTTGATVLSGLDSMPRGILLWRGLLQMLGGLGVIMIAIAVLPLLKIGGLQLLRTEFSEKTDKALPRASQLATAIAFIYFSLMGCCLVAYWTSGMQPFDALVHAMTTVATGGLSTSDLSMGAFSAEAQWIAVFFMIAGSLPFVLLVRAFYGRPSILWQDSQVRAFLYFLAGLVLTVGILLWLNKLYPDPLTALRIAALNIASVMTTTGFTSTDFQLWGSVSVPFFFFLMMVGGCTGSTTGSLKIFRWQILTMEARRQIDQTLDPKRVISRRYNGKPVPGEIAQSVVVYLFIVLSLIGFGTAALALTGASFITALSGSVTAISNVGPGLGPVIGPSGTFAPLPEGAKWLLALLMVLGRLEILTVLVLFDPGFWRR